MKALLVDGNNVLSRADFAAKGKGVEMSADGVNTASLTIFINMLSRYVRMVKPTHISVYWDAGHDYRDQVYPAYKAARRKPSDTGGDSQPFEQAKQFLALAGVPHLAVPGWEADDLLAAATRQCEGDVVILSGDKDLLQLVRDASDECSGSVVQVRPPDDDLWGADDVRAKFGVRPEHLPLYLALVGDASDGIPGVRGLGPKRAVRLLEEAEGDWDRVLESLGSEKAADAAVMRRLVDLRTLAYPEHLMYYAGALRPFIPVRPRDWPADWQHLQRFCQAYRLESVLRRLEDGSMWVDNLPTPTKPDEMLFEAFL